LARFDRRPFSLPSRATRGLGVTAFGFLAKRSA
jgi:hypothetical protein